MTAAGRPSGPDQLETAATFSIGTVLTQLRADYPYVSISKIRYLEAEGLVTPRRTPAGYRQYSRTDVARLRYVLGAQRDHYLPLKVIKDQLDAIDRGLETEGGAVRLPRSVVAAQPAPLPELAPGSGAVIRMTRTELLAESGLQNVQLRELEQFGLILPAAGGYYDADTVLMARTVAELIEAGMEPRHLRPFRSAADREAVMVSQLVAAQARQKNPDARERAEEQAVQLAGVLMRLHALLVKSGIKRELGG